MLHVEVMVVCFMNHADHLHVTCEKTSKFLVLSLVVQTLTNGL